jgi:SAM-dependent methyltransferase
MLQATMGRIHGAVAFERRTRVLADALATMIPSGSSVLDVGTGDGRIAALVSAADPTLRIEGIDVLVRERTHVPVRAFDGTTLPCPDRSVDVVTFVDVLHHADNPGALLGEAARVARRAVVVKDHIAETAIDHATLRLMDWVGNAPHGVALPYNYASRAAWDARFAAAGLRAEAWTDDIPLYPFPLDKVFGRGLHFIARFRPRA